MSERQQYAPGDLEARFELLAANAQECALFDLDSDGRISSWNIGAERLTGYTVTEILGRPSSEIYSAEDVGAEVLIHELVAAKSAGPVETKVWCVRKDGSRFHAQITLLRLGTNAKELRGFTVMTRDISTDSQFEERFRRVVESAPNAMVMINRNGLIEMVNTQAEQVFGYGREEMLGQLVELLVPERFRHHHSGLRDAFYGEPQSRPMGAGRDLYGRRKDGSEFPIEIGLNPIETDEGTMVLSAILDISDRKLKEQKIEAALTEKNILLGEIHHRVKNNLQIVHSLLDLQSARIEDQNLLTILRDSQNRIHAMALIHQTLYQSNNFSKIDFSEVLHALVPTLVESYGMKQSQIHYRIDADPVFLSINASIPCGLIVNELITNSLKHAFTKDVGGTITVGLKAQGSDVVLIISDDGVGIPVGLDLKQSETLGLQLITLLAAQLGAELNIQRAQPTQFALKFSSER